jgi:outer membrane protein
MMKSLIRPLSAALVIAVGVLAVSAVQAQELRIGYVNGDRVLRDAAPAKAALAKLEAEFGKRDKELNDQATRLKAAAPLGFGQRGRVFFKLVRRQRELVEQDRDLQRKRREFQEDFAQRKNEETQVLVERANRAIKQIFEQDKYDLIIQDAVFASSKVDITDKVIKSLNTAAGAK